MKRKLTLAAIAMILTIALCLTGCSSRTALTADSFSEAITAAGYTVTDVTEEYSDYSEIVSARRASPSDGTGTGFDVLFFVYTDSESAGMLFDGAKALLEENAGSSRSYTSVDLFNYQKYTISSGGSYNLLSRIDNTLIYISTSSDRSASVKELIEQLGY